MTCLKALVRGVAAWLVLLGLAAAAGAAVKLPAIFGDNMVLQRGQSVPIWGQADKGEQVTVCLAGESVSAEDGRGGQVEVRASAKLDWAALPNDVQVRPRVTSPSRTSSWARSG